MLFKTTVKFLSALVGSLVAFYLAAHLFHAAGFMSAYELQRVGWMYNQLLEPITSLDWTTRKTGLIAIAAIAVQALLVGAMFRKWSYKPVTKIDPLARVERTTGGVIASGERLPSREVSIYSGADDAEHTEETTPDEVAEQHRLMSLLGHKIA